MDANVSSGLFALAGALVGGASGVAAQWMTARSSERAAQLAEMREMFRAFLATSKGPERLVERKRNGEDIPWSEMADQTSGMWLAFQVMDAFCPRPLVDAAHAYIDTIYVEFESNEPAATVGQLMRPARASLASQARHAFSEYL